jgi:hypothetical protein
MSRLVIVENDPVRGTDTHNVKGVDRSVPPNLYTGTGDFDYDGAMADRLVHFVRIAGMAVAVVSSGSRLNAGQDGAPAGRHWGPMGSNFTPAAPPPNTDPSGGGALQITDAPLGAGVPNAGAGSALLTVDGVKVLLDADEIDTCSGVGATAGSTVTATGQDFVTCSS